MIPQKSALLQEEIKSQAARRCKSIFGNNKGILNYRVERIIYTEDFMSES